MPRTYESENPGTQSAWIRVKTGIIRRDSDIETIFHRGADATDLHATRLAQRILADPFGDGNRPAPGRDYEIGPRGFRDTGTRGAEAAERTLQQELRQLGFPVELESFLLV